MVPARDLPSCSESKAKWNISMPSYNKKCLLFSKWLVRILVLKLLISWGHSLSKRIKLIIHCYFLKSQLQRQTHTSVKASTFFFNSKTEKIKKNDKPMNQEISQKICISKLFFIGTVAFQIQAFIRHGNNNIIILWYYKHFQIYSLVMLCSLLKCFVKIL